MNINLLKEQLEEPLSQVIGVVEKRQTLPILGNVYLGLDNGVLTLIGSDLETEITTQVSGVKGQDGKITVSAKKLFDICRSLPANAVLDMSLAENNQMVVTAGKSRFSLQTLPASDYPRLVEAEWKHEFTVTQQELAALLSRTAFSMAQQDVRYFLNGLLLEFGADHITSVATDGHRLAKTSVAATGLGISDVQSIVPRKAVGEMIRFLDADSDSKVSVKLNSGHIWVQSEEYIFISKLIDGRFPDYEKVIPGNLDKHIELERATLIEILNRAAILSNEKFRGVSLNLSNNLLQVASHNPDQEQATDEMAIEYSGDPLEIGFNVTYLLEALKACQTETVVLGLLNPNTSCTFQAQGDTETLYLIMPMKL